MMKIFAALMVLIAFSAGAQACWVPPTNVVDNSTHEVEPVKVVEPVEGTTTEEEATDDSSTDEETEVVAPVVDTADDTTEEVEVVETPVAETPVTETETETEVKVPMSSGYGEAHIIGTTTTEIVQDAESHPVETEPVIITAISSNSAVEQNDDSNVTAMNTGSNNGSYTSVGIALVLAVLIAVAIYYIRK
ncbi:hypothetical protein [uncultured Methanomethylovorans sp.]|uniref:hypothetical protein n=1 Tax=uncultured Methanomethylovorans sp. TaxID=183759 RepID=UPI002AA8FEAB|nr:hypothetical protein [uncultured Methanomethylovorans sp.]